MTLALGVGAITTCFSVLNAVAFRPIPFAHPDELVAINLADRGGAVRSLLSLTEFDALHEAGAVSGSAAYVPRAATLSGASLAERVQAAEVSGDLFAVLGVPVEIGRPLAVTDAGTRVAVISDSVWVRAFGSSPDVVGASVSVDGDSFVIVGVARRGFSFPQDARIWLPLADRSGDRRVEVVARLEAGVSPAQADGLVGTVSERPTSAAGRSAAAAEWTARTMPLRVAMLGTKQRDMSLFVLTAAGLVLLVACANLAGLLTASVAARQHEMAVRSAIGADRFRLVRQLMTESGLLAIVGGGLGVLFAQWGVDAFGAGLGKPRGAEWVEFAIDGRVLAFALLASMLTAVLFGLAPALGGARVDLRGVLQDDGRAVGPGRRARRLRSLLVAGQVALSVALLAGAGSVISSSMGLGDVDAGFDRDRLLGVRVALAGRAYGQPEPRLGFIDAAEARLRSLPGVLSVTATSAVPVMDRDVPYAGVALEDGRTIAGARFGSIRFVDAGYMAAMGIPIRRGRPFTAGEARGLRDRAIVVNDTMARRVWPEGDPLGQRLRLTADDHVDVDGWYTVVGVVGDVSQRQLPAAPENQMYLPLGAAREVTLAVRTAADPATLAAAAREAVRAVDPTLAISTTTMASASAFYEHDRRMQGLVLGTLGGIAMLLAALGVYGATSLMVAERRREIAIRLALGSSEGAVLRLVLGRGVGMASLGVGVGLPLALALTTFLSSIFRGLRAVDGPMLASTALLLGVAALTSSWWPARRAMRVDPMVTLKG